MPTNAKRVYRHYDTSTKLIIAQSKNSRLFSELDIPRSTARYWSKSTRLRIVAAKLPEVETAAELRTKFESLEKEVKALRAVVELQREVASVTGQEIAWQRFPEGPTKEKILDLVANAAANAPLKQCLEVIGLSRSRFGAWKRRVLSCQLDDRRSCPKISLQQLTSDELSKMEHLYHDPKLNHLSLASLSLHAQRTNQLYCSSRTWSKYASMLGWKRDRLRVYPFKEKIGVRADAPNRIWHIDVTQIRLSDRRKFYVQAVIDNYSRYVLAWTIGESMGGLQTRETLRLALQEARRLGSRDVPNVYSDGGFENVNRTVDKLIKAGLITRTVAQFEVSFSNSMIEALFSALKNRYLYQQTLSSPESLERAVSFYFREHNETIPQQALGGARPVEVISGTWSSDSRAELLEQAQESRRRRWLSNSEASCVACPI